MQAATPLRKRWRNRCCRCYGNRQVNSPPPSIAVTWHRFPLWRNTRHRCWHGQQAIGNGIKSRRNIMRVSLWSRATEECVWLVVTKKNQTQWSEDHIVRENWETSKWRFAVWLQDLVSTVVQLHWECVIQWRFYSSRVINTLRRLKTDWIDCCVDFINWGNPHLCCN
jgi:hypothetical protein